MDADLTDEELLNRFEKEANMIRTRVDELVKLIKQKGEISFEDAAKELDVSLSTIEAWANFLEEENILSIKYNFTTPFLTIFREKIKKEPDEEETVKKETSEGNETKRTKFIKKEGLSDIQIMLAEAYTYIKKKDFEKAKKIYAEIKAKYDSLPKEFLEKKDDLNTGLIKLSRNLGLNLSKASRNEMEKKSSHIQRLLNMLNQKIKKKEVLDAIKIYGQIKLAYDNLPPGFLEQKLLLQNKIVDLYEVLITMREEQDMRDVSTKRSEIIHLLEEMNQAINIKNIRLAIKLYEKVRALYNSLPTGFLQEKAELQSRTIRLYEKLLSDYKKITIEDMENKTAKIESLSRIMNNYLTKGDVDSARKTYTQIKDVFYTLPEGFLRQKTKLQRTLLSLYEKLASQLDKSSISDFSLKYEKINKMLEDAFNHVKNQRFDLANKLYKQIMSVYNSMPAGFLQKKTDLRTRILAFYKDISSQEVLEKNMINIPEFKEKRIVNNKGVMEVPLPQAKNINPEKDVDIKKSQLKISDKIKPPIQVSKPMPFLKPKTVGVYKKVSLPPPPIPLKFSEEKKSLKPISKQIINKPARKSQQSLFTLFKKDKDSEIKPPTPPEYVAKK